VPSPSTYVINNNVVPLVLRCWTFANNLDQSLNDAAVDKIRKYRSDYNNSPPSTVSFMPPIPSTSGRLHSEFVRLLSPVTSSTSPAWLQVSLNRSRTKLPYLSLRLQFYVLILT
jgi:hypothetical protein